MIFEYIFFFLYWRETLDIYLIYKDKFDEPLLDLVSFNKNKTYHSYSFLFCID